MAFRSSNSSQVCLKISYEIGDIAPKWGRDEGIFSYAAKIFSSQMLHFSQNKSVNAS